MGTDASELAEALPYPCAIKLSSPKRKRIVSECGQRYGFKLFNGRTGQWLDPHILQNRLHRLMCLELMKLVERISMVFPEIEAAQPRCHSGIKVLCSLNLALDKAKSLLQQCSESSKLYLALSGDAILSRCERLRASLERSLSQIQSMVPVALAVEISGIINDLRSATFSLESSEEEAGKFLRSLLQDASASDPAESFY
ncbi:hypothetical protein RJ641_011009 [Dillenia turbinata]|uniref:Uncharacterized protein n=1 Tax=Dillenia turbinata TaxID=194707 RepID=A0AAN8UVC8_9MAGN